MDVYFFVFIGIAFLGLIYLSVNESKNKTISIRNLIFDGFKHVFSGGGDQFIAFNVKRGRFRFGTLSDYSFVERPISYIEDYEWKWKERDARKITNKFFFYISDVNYYMHEVFYSDKERLAETEWAKLQAVLKECINAQYIEIDKMPRTESYDFFISHASEDKDSFVRPLVKALSSLGLKVLYDEFTLEIGDSLRRSIDDGLSTSRFGIVVLSKAFFAKQWPQYELDALVNRSMSGKKVILPIWHGVQHQDVSNYSHSLADKLAYSTSSLSIETMAQELLKLVRQNG